MKFQNKEQQYQWICIKLRGVVDNNPHFVSRLANASALLNEWMDQINWVGFYLWENDQLVLGPFQGKVACVTIPFGKGVCGMAVKEKRPILVPNVHEFDGHIACDSASNSEVVIPITKEGNIVGVLDVDSPVVGRFDQRDLQGLIQVGKILEEYW